MNLSTRSSIQLFGVYCGPLYMILLLVGWWIIAGFLPPTAPGRTAFEVVALFQQNTTRIRIGMIVVMYAAMIFIPFAAVTSQFVARIEGGAGVLTYCVLLGGVGNMILTFYPAIWWLAAAYRPDRAADVIYGLNDMAWLQFIGGVSLYDAFPLALAAIAFCDTSSTPVFPRWAGYFNLMVVLLLCPNQLLFFFHSGPFAWNGLFGLWIPLAVFGVWFLTTFWLMRRAVLREREQPGLLPAGAAV